MWAYQMDRLSMPIYPLSTLPEHIHSTICTIDTDGGMCCIIKKSEAKREQ